MTTTNDKRVFWGCFIALIATAFGFIVRTQVMDAWADQFNLTETQKGEIFGVGLWPFAISIVLFSLVIDRIGYGLSMVFAFAFHVIFVISVLCASLVLPGEGTSATDAARAYQLGYWILYVGNFIGALGNGTVEAVINPVVATMFSREKTKWLNILHAGWPGGLVLGGVLAIAMGAFMGNDVTLTLGGLTLNDWQLKFCLILIPVLTYAVLLLGCKFPVSERVATGISYKEMLREAGILGAAVVVALIVRELGRVFDIHWTVQIIVGVAIVGGFGAYVRSLGRPLFFFLLLIMIPLAITELGTDSWITDLMRGEMDALGLNPGWVLVYTSFIMLVLRFFAGPIVHALSPLGLLAVSAAVAAVGLVALSASTLWWTIFLAATLYGFGKTFFWPTMLGVVAEQSPKGGALTLNAIAGVGMLSVGIIGTSMLGFLQDTRLGDRLQEKQPALYEQVIAEEPKMSVFGPYLPLEDAKVAALPEEETDLLSQLRDEVRKNVLAIIALLPVLMLLCYISLIIYFRAKGGYKAEVLTGHKADDEEFTGGVEGPVR